jgi:hypothetical protein
LGTAPTHRYLHKIDGRALAPEGRRLIARRVNAWKEVAFTDESSPGGAAVRVRRGTGASPGLTQRREIVLTDVFTNDRHFAAAGFTPLF